LPRTVAESGKNAKTWHVTSRQSGAGATRHAECVAAGTYAPAGVSQAQVDHLTRRPPGSAWARWPSPRT